MNEWKLAIICVIPTTMRCSLCVHTRVQIYVCSWNFHKKNTHLFSTLQYLVFVYILRNINFKHFAMNCLPHILSNNAQSDIMAIAMKETMIQSNLPLYDFQISELSVNTNRPYKYHFR